MNITCGSVEVKPETYYEVQTTIKSPSKIKFEGDELKDLIRLIGTDVLLDEIGEEQVREYFEIE